MAVAKPIIHGETKHAPGIAFSSGKGSSSSPKKCLLVGSLVALASLMNLINGEYDLNSQATQMTAALTTNQSNVAEAEQEALNKAIAPINDLIKNNSSDTNAVQELTAAYNKTSQEWNAKVQQAGAPVDIFQQTVSHLVQACQLIIQNGGTLAQGQGFLANLLH